MDFEAESDGEPRSSVETTRPELFQNFRPVESRQSGALLGGRYQICGFLTKGATSRVYLAEDLATREAVVVKMLAPEAFGNSEMRERLLREAVAARAVNHPNVVRILDTGETGGGIPYVVMEALVGECRA
jgi:eukaryotic-like serine/threonine-protein kinase